MEASGSVSAGLGAMAQALATEGLKGAVIGKTLEAMDQMQQLQTQQKNQNYQKMVMGAAGIGLQIDKMV